MPIDGSRSLSTLAIHGGLECDPAFGSILAPIHQTATFVQEAVGVDKGFTYSRTSNPTVAALERALSALDGGMPAAAFGTGMAAVSAVCLALLEAGDHVVVSDVVYGGTVRLLRQVLARFGVAATSADTSDPDALARALRRRTRLVVVESPANPTLKLTDLRAAAAAAHDAGALLVADNTFLTPVLQDCFGAGADLVVYSTTKYLEGHNATVGGAVLARDPAVLEKIRFVRNAVGLRQAPFEAWLTLRGLKTLPARMKLHSEHALAVARRLEAHPRVERVLHPALPSFPQRDLALRQQRAGGGMIAFEVAGGAAAGVRLLNAVRLVKLAESLGSVESLVTHPATMTHAAVPAAEREALGIGAGLVRLSVGLEDPADVIEDLDQALAAAEVAS